ncbi:hypothetical protein SY88_03690 [Clostridiales bacterium PH28_bin88]|nr:hypothetical protein SY88_03690 [Clostridiales bacterium PH28_bin88]
MMRVDDVAGVVRARLLRGKPDNWITGVNTDSRGILPGELFFALRGERFDGHRFVAAALTRGAAGAVVSQPVELPVEGMTDQAILLVPDTLQALQRLARDWRDRFPLPVVGITGSNGKTTTKDMTAAVLDSRWPTLKNTGNYNNEIGLPLTLLQLSEVHRAVVVEMGMRGLGQIHDLCRVARPTVGVITNIGLTHLELLGSPENIARAKGELLEEIPPDGFALINGDDLRCRDVSSLCRGKVYFFGLDAASQVRATEIRPRGFQGTDFTVQVDGLKTQAFIPILGEHNVRNALAAIGVGYYLGLDLEEVTAGLARVKLSGMRLEVRQGAKGITVINDAYNANPASMKASLRVLSQMRKQRAIAVLGDMYELGTAEASGHREVGFAVADLGIDMLVAVGPLSREMAAAAKEAGMSSRRVEHFNTKDEAVVFLREVLRDSDTVLVKASRGMKMELIVEQIME